MDVPDRARVAGGVASPAFVLLTVVVGAVSAPAFDWPGDPFSLVGTTGGVVAALFNAGLVAAGLAALPFGRHLWRTWSRATGALYAVIGLSLVGAGLVPAAPDAVLHEVFGTGVFLGIWVLLWVAGIVDWRVGNRRAGIAAFGLGSVTLAVWLPYDLGVRGLQIGYGAAELVSFLAFAAWSSWMAARLGGRSSAERAGRSGGERARRREETAS